MVITEIETFIVDAGWRPWVFVALRTDEGITGYGECSARTPRAIVGMIEDLASLLIGKDPRAYEMRFWDLERVTRSARGGVAAMAIAGIENALLDITAKAHNMSVVELFGGPTRDRVRVYWSHCGTSRIRAHKLLGVPPLRTMDDIADLGREVVTRGFTALKTNILYPGDTGEVFLPGRSGGYGTTDQIATKEVVDHIVNLIGTFRSAIGPNVDLLLDLNFNFKTEGCIQIARALEPFNLLWLEIDMHEPAALRQVKDATSTRICTGETLYYMDGYLPYFQHYSADVFMIDLPWNGFVRSKQVGDLAHSYQFNIAPHNYYSHLSSFMSASLCAVLPNVRIMEIDIDDVPWKDELTTQRPEIIDGYMVVPTRPGWGADLNEDVARAHPWKGK
jgi:galactonate dehydratase